MVLSTARRGEGEEERLSGVRRIVLVKDNSKSSFSTSLIKVSTILLCIL